MRRLLTMFGALFFLMIASNAEAQDLENQLYLDLKDGRVVIDLRTDVAPEHVARIKELTREGFYDGIVFHRVIDGFMAQTGDPTGTGMSGVRSKTKGGIFKCAFRAWHCRHGSLPGPEQRRQSVFHLLGRCPVPERSIHGLGRGQRGHGACRWDHKG